MYGECVEQLTRGEDPILSQIIYTLDTPLCSTLLQYTYYTGVYDKTISFHSTLNFCNTVYYLEQYILSQYELLWTTLFHLISEYMHIVCQTEIYDKIMQYSKHFNASHCITIQCCAVLCSTVTWNKVQFITVQYNTVWFIRVQFNIIQCSVVSQHWPPSMCRILT